ncbi:MAG: non-canonical purine NTP pyrophosphatase [Candidatus Magasanikbacteria bacterium]
MRNEILIATTNKGKFDEIKKFLDDLPFTFLSLDELKESIPEPEEIEETIDGNAILKAKYYGEKTGMLTLADDGGLFIDELSGWPGVRSARVAHTSDEQCDLILDKMKDIPEDKRSASFQVSIALFNPTKNTTFLAKGITEGKIEKKAVESNIKLRYGYNRVFYVDQAGKTYAELSIEEKNAVSHRGKALSKIKYFLQNQFSTKHLVVPIGILVRDGKILITKRNDPHRPEYHQKWEFPGGSVEFGETTKENLIREVKEEAGYDVEVLRLLQEVYVREQDHGDWKYQIYLLPYICSIIGGDGVYSDAEVLDAKWISIEEIDNYHFVGENKELLKKVIKEIQEFI